MVCVCYMGCPGTTTVPWHVVFVTWDVLEQPMSCGKLCSLRRMFLNNQCIPLACCVRYMGCPGTSYVLWHVVSVTWDVLEQPMCPMACCVRYMGCPGTSYVLWHVVFVTWDVLEQPMSHGMLCSLYGMSWNMSCGMLCLLHWMS